MIQFSAKDEKLGAVDTVMTHSDGRVDIGALRRAVAKGSDRIIPPIGVPSWDVWLMREKHVCPDLTALDGNISLLSGAAR
ncbi:MAG: hypothetical protein AAF442_07475 [Pseudomonadota bacterium]